MRALVIVCVYNEGVKLEKTAERIYNAFRSRARMPPIDVLLADDGSTDSIPQTSRIAYSLRNRLMGSAMGGLEARLRISQYYSMLNVDAEKPFSPVLMETTMSSGSLNFSANASYDIYDKNITETIASVSYNWEKGFVSAGKNLRVNNLPITAKLRQRQKSIAFLFPEV